VTKDAFERPNALPMAAAHAAGEEPSDGCLYLHAPRHMERNDPQMAEGLHIIRNLSATGERILDMAEEGHVRFSRADLGKGINGLYRRVHVAISHNASLDDDICVLPHEIMHWIHSGIRIQDNWDYRSRLLCTLSKEAAAEACAIKVVHELRENGYQHAFNSAAYGRSRGSYSRLYNKFNYIFNRANHRGRRNPSLDATDAAFHKYYKLDRLVHTYGNNVLLDYMEDIPNVRHHYPEYCFDAQTAGELARISADEYLVYDPVILPDSDDKLFRKNRSLRQAFECTEMIHILNYCGGDDGHPMFQQKWAALERDRNPYRFLGLESIISEYKNRQDQGFSHTVIEVKDDLARFG
jgi:hypothetical protein